MNPPPFVARIVSGKSGKQSALIALDDLYPECTSLIWDTELPNLSCWVTPNSCHRGTFATCMGELVERAYKLFTGMEHLEVIVLYWEAEYKDAPFGRRKWGLVIERDEDSEMRLSPLNRWALHKLNTDIGKKFQVDFGG